MPVPSDLMGNMMKRLFAEVRSTDADGNAVISVGWGGDIPLFPPFVGLGSLVVGLLLARILGRRPFVPAPLNLLIVRVAIFAAAVRHPTSKTPARLWLRPTLSSEDPPPPCLATGRNHRASQERLRLRDGEAERGGELHARGGHCHHRALRVFAESPVRRSVWPAPGLRGAVRLRVAAPLWPALPAVRPHARHPRRGSKDPIPNPIPNPCTLNPKP